MRILQRRISRRDQIARRAEQPAAQTRGADQLSSMSWTTIIRRTWLRSRGARRSESRAIGATSELRDANVARWWLPAISSTASADGGVIKADRSSWAWTQAATTRHLRRQRSSG